MATLRNSNAEQWLQEAQQGLDYNDPQVVSKLFNNLVSAGRPVEYSGSGDIIKFLNDDAGGVDVLQNKAFEEGRGPVRGFSFQPFYLDEDFDRLRAEGRNPHTGDYMGAAAMMVGKNGPAPAVGMRRPRFGTTAMPQMQQAQQGPQFPSDEGEADERANEPWFLQMLRFR